MNNRYRSSPLPRAMGRMWTRLANESHDMHDQSLPTGVIIEIVSRLPIKTLAQCQLICKEWRALIQDRYFTEMHLDRGDVIYNWYNVVVKNDEHTRQLRSFTYMHGCNGLILIKDVDAKKHYVWNPAIHRALELPDPHKSSQGFAFSYVPATKSYRIVSFYKDYGKNLCCQVLTPGDKSGNVWRPLDVPEIEKSFNKKGAIERVSVVSCEGAVHYVLVTEVGNYTNVDIVSLGLETERFTVSRFPISLVSWKNYWDVDWDGKLAFADIVGENLEVVELEDYKGGRWCEKKRVVHLAFSNRSNAIPLFVQKGEIWFWSSKDEKIFKYTIKTGRCTDELLAQSLALSSKTLPYKPSLISFEGMVPDTMLETLRPSKLC